MIKIIWNRDPSTMWEVEWIEYLFRNIPHITIDNHKEKKYYDNSIIIDAPCWSHDHFEYLTNLKKLTNRFGLIHLSDEDRKSDTRGYELSQFIIRNYLRTDIIGNCYTLPLGVPNGYMHKASNISSLDIRELASRKYLVAAIFGRFDPIRQQIFDHFRGTAGAYIYVSNYTGPPLSPQQIRAVYDQSVFVLCPPGALIQDTFRVYEALMAGAVPIVEDDPYWTELYGLEVPFVKVRKWSETIEKINQLASSPATLSRLRNHARIWWDLKVRYCEEIAKFCANLLM